MRIAVLIITLCLTMILGLQSCAINIGGNITSNKDLSGAGAVGLLMAFLFVIGAALVLRLPKASMVIFFICGLLGVLVASSSPFKDAGIWGGLSFVLSLFSYFGSRELRKSTSSKPAAE